MQTTDWIALAGAVAVLLAYAAHLLGRMRADRALYSLLNLVGGLLLTTAAAMIPNVGFLVIDGAWSVVSLAGLVRALRAAG